jgi:chromate reductase, NAD(P)H dehydrogenase (quinone)
MEKQMNVCVLVGSLRKASFNGMLANTLISLAPSSMKLDIVEIGNFPLYNQDLETNPPPAQWTAFRQSVMAADAVLFVTPEYNRSVPAALKNALDVGSRPYGSSVWDRMPGAIVSSSPGAIGAFGANHHLRQSLVFLNVPTMQQPEAYVSHVDKAFDEHGKLASDGTGKFLQEFMQAFANWVETIRSYASASDGLRQPCVADRFRRSEEMTVPNTKSPKSAQLKLASS